MTFDPTKTAWMTIADALDGSGGGDFAGFEPGSILVAWPDFPVFDPPWPIDPMPDLDPGYGIPGPFDDHIRLSDPVRFDGGRGYDWLRGSDGKDTLVGGADGDTLYGHAGHDRLFLDVAPGKAWTGEDKRNVDVARGGTGNDWIVNRAGDGRLYGDGGNDTLLGGIHQDQAYGGVGRDVITLRDGSDTGWGDAGNDTMSGGAGRDTLYGGTGNDRLKGDKGDDHLYGGSGRDVLGGGDGDDWLNGGDGRDVLKGGTGDDLLTGGSGRDVFLFVGDGTVGARERDTIFDFQIGHDQIKIQGATAVDSYGDLTVTGSENHTTITFGERTILVYEGGLSASDFIFA